MAKPKKLDQLMTGTYTDAELKLLSHFVTNLDSNVFGFKNLPQVVAGAIFAAYSRSALSAREILIKKFLGDDDFKKMAGDLHAFTESHDASLLVDPAKAEAFYDRVLVQYGDDSVAELATTHMAIEQVSNVVVKLIEDRRIGINPLEKSSRYVQYNDKDTDRHYRYLRDAKLMKSKHKAIYLRTMDSLFDLYSELIEPLKAHLAQKFPQKEGQSDTAYNAALRAQACDVVRYLLPMGTLTNVGLVGNGRAFEYLITCLKSTPFTEAHEIADKLLDELRQLLPAFVRRIETERGQASIDYLTHRAVYESTVVVDTDEKTEVTGPSVRLIDFDPAGETKVAAALAFEASREPFDGLWTELSHQSKDVVRSIIRAAYPLRGHRTHKPSRAFEHTDYTFDIVCDIGAFRDLQRHRVLTQQRQPYSTVHGYVVPQDIIDLGVEAKYREVMDQAKMAYDTIVKDFPSEAQYVVPFGYLIRFTMKMNAREAFHLCELRSAIQGHWSYRWVAQEMARAIANVHPAIGDGMMIDWSESGEMARLKAEQRQEEKLQKLGFERDY